MTTSFIISSSQTGATSSVISKIKNDRFLGDDDDDFSAGTGTSTNIDESEGMMENDIELPTVRELSKILLGLVADETSSGTEDLNADQLRHHLATIRQIERWTRQAATTSSSHEDAIADNIEFLSNVAEFGGVRILLQFLEDHVKDPTAVVVTMKCLATLLETNDEDVDEGSEANDNDEEEEEKSTTTTNNNNSKKLGYVKRKLAQMTIHNEGIEILLRAFKIHAYVDDVDAAIGKKATQGSSSSSGSSFWKTLSKSFSTMVRNPNELKSRSVGENDYDYISVLAGDLDLCVENTLAGSGFEWIRKNDEEDDDPDVVYTPQQAATKSTELLALLLAHCQPARAASVLHFFATTVPKLLRIHRQRTTHSAAATDAALMLGITSCLVAGTDVDGVVEGGMMEPKELVAATVSIMKAYPHHAAVNVGGCILIEELGPMLSKDERRALGVIAVLGELVMSMDMDMVDVKRVADTILAKLS